MPLYLVTTDEWEYDDIEAALVRATSPEQAIALAQTHEYWTTGAAATATLVHPEGTPEVISACVHYG